MKAFAILAGLVAVFGAIHVAGGRLWLNTPYYLIDLWFTGDVAWRAWLGQVPHLDFGTPVGQAYFWIYRLASSIAGPTTASLLLASVLAGVLAALLAWGLLRRDVPAWLAVLIALYAFGCAVTPRWMGHGWPAEFSHLAPYNRWGWAFLIPVALFPLLPQRPARTAVPEAVLLGVGAAFLALLKITYGLAAAGFVGLALVALHLRLATAAIAVAAGCAVLLLTQLFAGNLGAYVSDIVMALTASEDSLYQRAFERRTIARTGVLYGLAVAAILLLGVRRDLWPLRFGAVVRRLWRPAIFCAALLVVGFGLAVQNHPIRETPFFATAVILAYTWARPGLAGALGGRGRAPQAISVALVVLAFGYTSGRDLASIVLHRAGALSAGAVAVPELEGSVFGGLRLPAGTVALARAPVPADPEECRRIFGRVEGQLQVALDGIAALDEAARPDDVVLDLRVFNPYPAIRTAPAPTGGLLWFDPGRTFGAEHHPDARTLLRSADVVVRETGCPREDSLLLWQIYGDAIEAEFAPVAETGTKRVYTRPLSADGFPRP